MTKARIALAANFERNLEAIGLFLAEAGAPAGVLDDLVNAIVSRLFPLLESHPRAGRDWMLNPPPTESGKLLQQRIAKKLRGRRELREIVLDQHLVLYAINGNTVALLAIRHGRELGFDVA
jgi:hypothetical protein